MSISFIIKRKNINVIFAKGFLLYRVNWHHMWKLSMEIRKTTNLEFSQFIPMCCLAATSLCCANQICSNCCTVPWLQNISPNSPTGFFLLTKKIMLVYLMSTEIFCSKCQTIFYPEILAIFIITGENKYKTFW